MTLGATQAIAPKRDIPAGVAVAGLLVPEAVAYSAIAGLSPFHALTAAVIGLVIYGLCGKSRFAIVSPTSSSATVLAAGLATLAATDQTGRALAAAFVVALVGLLFVAAGALKLGWIANFVSRAVLRGFAFGLAISIVLRQLPTIVGVSLDSSSAPLMFVALISAVGRWNLLSLAIGVIALVAILGLRRWPAVPGAFAVLAASIAASFMIDFSAAHIAVVGPILLTFERPQLGHLDWHMVTALANIALPLALILFVESWGTIRTLALRNGDRVEANRELVALGCANLLSGAAGGMAIGAGFSASSANEAAGAQSRAAGLCAALALAIFVLFAGPLIARVPIPVLGAVVIAALAHALDPRPILRLWRIDRDQIIASVAVIGVLVLGVLNGMVFAVALSVVALVRRIATPEIAILGQLGDTHNYVDIARHPDARTTSDILIIRPGEPMFFANAERIVAAIEQKAERDDIRVVILSLEESSDLDSTALDTLAETASRLGARHCTLILARMKDPVHDLLVQAGGSFAKLAQHGTRSVADAVESIRDHEQELIR